MDTTSILLDLDQCESQSDEALRRELLPRLGECSAAVIVGRDVDVPIQSDIMEVCRELHGLPQEKKDLLDISSSPGIRGYSVAKDIVSTDGPSFGRESGVIQSRAYASFEFGCEKRNPVSPEEQILCAPNRWMGIETFKRPIEEYVLRMSDLSQRIEHIFMRMLRLSENHFTDLTTEPFYHLRLLEYPALRTHAKLRLGAHTDYECFTFISQSDESLEIATRSGEWHRIPDMRGITMLVGDVIEAITGGMIESTLHRVVPSDELRHSVVFFRGPDIHAAISPLELPHESEHYKMDFQEHLLSRALENFPHLRYKIDTGEIRPPKGFGDGNPFRYRKIARQRY